MEGSVRVFAGEFSRSTLGIPSDEPGSSGWVVTPGGAFCRQIYLAGALTEVSENGGMVRGRVADPTGTFDIITGGRNTQLARTIQDIPIPSFVAVTGTAQLYQKNGHCYLSVRIEQITAIDRASRDQILLTTSEYTLRRLDQLSRAVRGDQSDEQMKRVIQHYAHSIPSVRDLAAMVGSAVQSLRPQEPEPSCADPGELRSVVITLLQEARGPRGISVEEIIDTLTRGGRRKEDVLAALEALIVDDECYQPQKGYVKLL